VPVGRAMCAQCGIKVPQYRGLCRACGRAAGIYTKTTFEAERERVARHTPSPPAAPVVTRPTPAVRVDAGDELEVVWSGKDSLSSLVRTDDELLEEFKRS